MYLLVRYEKSQAHFEKKIFIYGNHRYGRDKILTSN
jgi:hypothetical protein